MLFNNFPTFFFVSYFYVAISTSLIKSQPEQLCRCKLVMIENGDISTQLLDLTSDLDVINPMRSIADLTECEIDCRRQFSKFFNSNLLMDTENDHLPIELNSIPQATDKVCVLLGRESSSPGQTVLIEISKFGNGLLFSKLINLSKICCHR